MSGKRCIHMGLDAPPNEQMRAAGFTSESITKLVKDGAERARQAGHEIQLTFFPPEGFASALAGVRKELETGKWDALILGGGIRMAPHLTPQFEEAVNMGIEIVRTKKPELKILFQAKPDDIDETVRRGFS